MKKITLALLVALVAISGMAQVKIGKDFSLKIYGQVRTDIFYNSRANTESVDGLFYSYPKDEVFDENGNDINGSGTSNMYAVYSRMGFDFAGPMNDMNEIQYESNKNEYEINAFRKVNQWSRDSYTEEYNPEDFN